MKENMKNILLIVISSLLMVFNVQAGWQGQRKSRANPNSSDLKMNNLTYEDREQWRAILKWPDKCEQYFVSRGATQSGLEFWNLGNSKYLVQVECRLAAYQSVQMYFYYDKVSVPSISHLLEFTTFDKDLSGRVVSQNQSMLAGFGSFDRQSKTLTVWTKFRGGQDCGSLATYNIDPMGTVTLKEFKAKFECDGEAIEPEDYPRIFPQ